MKRIFKIAVIDGQGGGIGKALVEKLRREFSSSVYILALGTNSRATEQMLRAGADEGATGSNAIAYNAKKVDLIAGVFAIVMPNSLLGEVTPRMAEAVSESDAHKVLIPLNRCGLDFAGVHNVSLPAKIDHAVALIHQRMHEVEEEIE